MALYSLVKLTVMCALLQAAEAIPCTGTRTPDDPTSSPYGVYSNVKPVPVGKFGMEVTTVDLEFKAKTTPDNFNSDVTYSQHLVGCLFEDVGGTFECKTGKFPLGSDMTFTDGHFYDTSGMGSKFIPVDKPNLNPFEKFINENLRIQWCPTEKYFVVMVQGAPYELRSAGPMDVMSLYSEEPMMSMKRAYPKVEVKSSIPYFASGKVSYKSVFCGDDNYFTTMAEPYKADSRGVCLVTKITATVDTPDGKVTAEPYTSSGTSYSQFSVVDNGKDSSGKSKFKVTRLT
jgi:hypothetical protein